MDNFQCTRPPSEQPSAGLLSQPEQPLHSLWLLQRLQRLFCNLPPSQPCSLVPSATRRPLEYLGCRTRVAPAHLCRIRVGRRRSVIHRQGAEGGAGGERVFDGRFLEALGQHPAGEEDRRTPKETREAGEILDLSEVRRRSGTFAPRERGEGGGRAREDIRSPTWKGGKRVPSGASFRLLRSVREITQLLFTSLHNFPEIETNILEYTFPRISFREGETRNSNPTKKNTIFKHFSRTSCEGNSMSMRERVSSGTGTVQRRATGPPPPSRVKVCVRLGMRNHNTWLLSIA